MTPRPDVLIYTKPFCSYCLAAKALLQDKGVGYREIDVSRDEDERDTMVRRSGRLTVPQIFIGSEHVGGYDDLEALDQQGRLDVLLGING